MRTLRRIVGDSRTLLWPDLQDVSDPCVGVLLTIPRGSVPKLKAIFVEHGIA